MGLRSKLPTGGKISIVLSTFVDLWHDIGMKSFESYAAVGRQKNGVRENGPTGDREILARYSPDEQRAIAEKQRLLSSLGFFIGKDFEIPILLNEPGAGWHWNFKDNYIKIDPKDLLEKPLDYLRFVISHEGGHRRISRTDFIPPVVWQQPGFSFMMNAIEDPRDNNFVAEAYPKFREQMNLAYALDQQFEADAKALANKKLGSVPRFLQAGHEYIKQWFREANGKGFEIDPTLPKEVQEVVQKTLTAAQSSWWRYPSKEEADMSEATIAAYAEASYRINLEKVWPEFKKLVDEDVKDQKTRQMLDDMQKGKGESGDEGTPNKGQMVPDLDNSLTPQEKQELSGAMQGEDAQGQPKPIDPSKLSPELRKKLEQHFDSLPEEKKRELAEKARETLRAYEDEVKKPLEAKLPTDTKTDRADDAPPEPSHADPRIDESQTEQIRDKLSEMMGRDKGVYWTTMREMLPLIARLEDDLREIFVARRARAWETGFKFGKKIDIKKRMQEKAQGVPTVDSRAWQKREAPQEKDYAITLLVDLSGSMRGRKIEETFKAVVVLCEVLNKLSIKTEILGFNDRLHEFQSFSTTISDDVRRAAGGMLDEVSSSHARYNDDGWALQQASARLAREDASEKFLIVLSDGRPEPSSQHAGPGHELRSTVESIMRESDQKLVGLGIGPGTRHVETYYPNSIADVAVTDMAKKLADLLREAIANYENF